MELHLMFPIVFALYIVFGTIIALLSRRLGVKTTADYFVASYRLGGFLASMTYAATTYSAFMMLGLVGYSYATGVASLGFELIYLVATVGFLTLVGPRMWRLARERKWITPSEMLSDLYAWRPLGISIALIYMISLIPYTAAQLKGISEVASSLGLSYEVGVVIASIVLITWIILAGIWSVATTDAYQGILMISSAIALIVWTAAFLLPSKGIDLAKAINNLVNSSSGNLLDLTWSPEFFISMSTPWIFFAITNPHVVQRIYMPRDERSYKVMVKYFAFYGFTYTLITVSLGLLFRAYASTAIDPMIEHALVRERDSVTPTFLKLAHPLIASVVYTSIIAAAISTANSIVLTVASSITRDLYERRISVPNQRVSRAVTTISIVSLTIVAALATYYRPAFIVDLSVLSSVMLIPLAPITIIGVYSKPSRAKSYFALTSLLVGCGLTMALAIIKGPIRVLRETLMGIPISLLILVISTIIMLLPLLKQWLNVFHSKLS
ncbi:MAG: sodium:solute symporter family protein [Sulfolobales archaeon]|nr:sodium:solute symporter family protein [Sulfolobales archaeon]